MTTLTLPLGVSRQLTFEDFKGLRAEGYIRDSSLDQKDNYGPDLQRKAVKTFASTHGLRLGDEWYTDFITGTSAVKRSGFKKALVDAQLDLFDVLLVYHTSRFARNRADSIRYKEELRRLGKSVVFVFQGIISGNDNDFLNEGINEVLNEHYSRNLSRWIKNGLRMKHEAGVANGKPPLGYRSEKLDSGKRERKVPFLNGFDGDLKKGGIKALLALLRNYASGAYSYRSLADNLNAGGYLNRESKPFTSGSVEHVLSNLFYEGKAVYHPGKPDEEVRDGNHEVPQEVKDLWLDCQQVKLERLKPGQFNRRPQNRVYPLSGVLVCDRCGKPYHGGTVQHARGREYRRMYHYGRRCDVKPISINSDTLQAVFGTDVLQHVQLDEGWRDAVLRAIADESPKPDNISQIKRIESAIGNLQKQHLWSAITDEDFAMKFREFDRQLRMLRADSKTRTITATPNLDRAASLLMDLPAMWVHPGVDDVQRRDRVNEAFKEIRLRGHALVAATSKPQYVPLFAYATWKQEEFMSRVGVTGVKPSISFPPCLPATR